MSRIQCSSKLFNREMILFVDKRGCICIFESYVLFFWRWILNFMLFTKIGALLEYLYVTVDTIFAQGDEWTGLFISW